MEKLAPWGNIDFSNVKYEKSVREKDNELEKVLEIEKIKKSTKYLYNYVDINNDNKKYAFVFLSSADYSGTGGSTALLFINKGNVYVKDTRFTLVNNPVIISDSRTNGRNDLIMFVSGGGSKSHYVILKYNGTEYISNPTKAPELDNSSKVSGIAIVSDDISKYKGIELN
jgi:hypothetical protein